MTGKRKLIIDFVSEGHHSLHICHLLRFGFENGLEGVSFLLPRDLRDRVRAQLPPEVWRRVAATVRLLEEDSGWLRITKYVKNKRIAQCLFVEYLNLRETDSSLLYLFFESVIYQMALSPFPRFKTSGVMFRPTFYYRKRQLLIPGTGSRAIFLLKWIVAYILVKRPGIDSIFVLDPLAVDYAHAHWKSEKFKLIPDPLGPRRGEMKPIGSDTPVTKRPLILLIAGALSSRKGLHSTVDALANGSEATRRNVKLRVVGKPEGGFEDYVHTNLIRLRDMGVMAESDLRFISDSELDQCISESHVVLTPYSRFNGSSGLVIRAAHFGKPVISTNGGLLGSLVKRHQLGAAIDVGNTEAFSQCLERLVATGAVEGFDPTSARGFADSCDPEEFVKILLADLRG